MVEKTEKELKEKYPNKEKEIIIRNLGLTHKPNIDDLRESPSIKWVNCAENKYVPQIW